MAEPANKLYVAREADLDTLKAHWQAAREGQRRVVHLQSPLGGGKRAMVGELARYANAGDEDVLLWRVALHDEEDGLQTLLRLYAGLFSALHSSGGLKGRIEMALNAQLPQEPKRVQGWIQAFIEGLKKSVPKPGENQVQVTLPRDNPLLGLVEVTALITRKFPTLLEVQNAHHVQSLALVSLFEALINETSESRLLVILATETRDEAARAWWSPGLLDLLDRRAEDISVRIRASIMCVFLVSSLHSLAICAINCWSVSRGVAPQLRSIRAPNAAQTGRIRALARIDAVLSRARANATQPNESR